MKTLLLFAFLSFTPTWESKEVDKLSIDLNGDGKKDTLVFIHNGSSDPGDYHLLKIEWDNGCSDYLDKRGGAWIKSEYLSSISKAKSDLLAVVEINGKTALILKEFPFASMPNKYVVYTFNKDGKQQKIFEEHLEKFKFTNNLITGEKPDENWIRHKKVFKLKDSKFIQEK